MTIEVLKHDGYMWIRMAIYFDTTVSEAKKTVRKEFPMHDIRDLEFKTV